LQPYEWLKIDEAFVEREHAEATRERQRAHAASGPFVQSTLRLDQITAIVDHARTDPRKAAVLQKYWQAYKLLAAPYTHIPYRRRVPRETRKIPYKLVVERVFRVGSFSLEDHSALKRHFQEAGRPLALPSSAGDDARVICDYVQGVLKDGCMYAAPRENVLAIEDAQAPPFDPNQPLAVVPHVEPNHDDGQFFRVIRKQPTRVHIVLTDESDDKASHIQIQVYEPHLPSLSADAAALFMHESPKVVDALEFLPWKAWRNCITVWEPCGAADVAGCHQYKLAGQAAIADGTPLESLPAIVGIERLVDAGWLPHGDRGKRHESIEDRSFFIEEGYSRAPTYFSCLLDLDRLLQEGLPGLDVRQNNAYYRAALLGNQKQLVLKDMSVRQYQMMLKDQLVAVPGGGGGAPPEPPAPIHGPEFDEPPPPFLIALPGPLPPEENSGNEWEQEPDPVPWGPVPGPEPPAPGPEPPPVADPEPQPDALPVGLRPEWQELCLDWDRAHLPRLICGRPISLECRGGGASAPRRRLACPSAAHGHCGTSRSVRLCTHFGQAEVFGFFAVWAEAGLHGPRSHDADDHKGYKPNLAEIQAYLTAHGRL